MWLISSWENLLIMRTIKNIFFRIMAFALPALAFSACSGNTDEGEYRLTIRPDKTEIYADGAQVVSFTVCYGAEDVSRSADMHITWEKDGVPADMAAGKNTFSTSEPGTYYFTAQYAAGNQVVHSDKVMVTAVEPESVASSGFYRKMLGMEFTSIFCISCPFLAEAIENICDAYPGRLVPVSFHCDFMGADPMTMPMNAKFYEKVANMKDDKALPLFAFDMRKSTRDIINEYAKIESEMLLQFEKYQAFCGVAVSSEYDPSSGKVDVEARFITDVSGEYRCHIFLVEDGVEYTQAGHDGSSPYLHDNVVRAIASDNVFGSKLNKGNPLEPGKEYVYTKSFTLNEEFDAENMRVVACILSAGSDDAFHVNNTNECGLNGTAGYLYEE